MIRFIKKEAFFLEKFIQLLQREMIPLEIIDVSGNRYETIPQKIKHKIHIRDNKFFSALANPNAFSLGEAYINGYFDITGSIKDLYGQVCNQLLSKNQRKSFIAGLSKLFKDKWSVERKNIAYHYNVPSQFYRIFLGQTMGYTCGYYKASDSTMDDAQIEKMDIICRKLKLKKGETLLDIGCGWGNFAIHAAKYFGVKVTGITLSKEQKKYAEKWIEAEGLSDDITIKLINYRDLKGLTFDKISCIGMSEHVGKKNMPGFYRIVFNCLKKGGLFMQHTITTNIRRKKRHENTFMNKYMFPGGELMLEHDLVDMASQAGFELMNAENFRPHYVRTLNDWVVRMETNKNRLLEIVSDHVYRIYHVFFIGSMVAFENKEISLFQNLFYKTDSNSAHLTVFDSAYSK